MGNETSIKQMLLNMIKESMDSIGIEEGIVTKSAPIEIVLVNDKKIILSDVDLVIPERMRGYQVVANNDCSTTFFVTRKCLRIGDKVNLIQYNDKKMYYVLDRV